LKRYFIDWLIDKTTTVFTIENSTQAILKTIPQDAFNKAKTKMCSFKY